MMWAAFRSAHTTWEDVAVKAGLCQATVLNLVYGDTRFPRENTIFAILQALGTETFYKLPGRPGYVSADEFRGSKTPPRPEKK
jgi:hypothetical protein